MSQSLPRHILNLLIVAALVFQVLVPTGFMPDMDALKTGVIKITICGGHHNDTGDTSQSQKNKSSTNLCDFGLSHVFGLEAFTFAPLALLLIICGVLVLSLESVQRFYKPSYLWARGPPFLLN